MTKRIAALALALSAGLSPALAGAAAQGEPVKLPSGGESIPAYLARPAAQSRGKGPAVIVIHEWWGLNDWAREKARGFADAGFVTLAVDLYRGQSASDPDTAHQLSRGLPEDRALRDLEAAFAWLAARPDVDPARIGVVGWCMGGGQALALAIDQPRLAAGVIYYGRLVTDPAKIARIKAPLLGNFGEEDKGIPAASVKAFADEARKAGVQVDFKVYPGAGHAFASAASLPSYRPDAAKDADARTMAFLEAKLKKR